MTEENRKPLRVMLKLKKQLFKQVTNSPESYVFDGSQDLSSPFEKPEGFIVPREGEDFILMSPKMTISGHVSRIVNTFEFANEYKLYHTQTIGITLVMFDDFNKFKQI